MRITTKCKYVIKECANLMQTTKTHPICKQNGIRNTYLKQKEKQSDTRTYKQLRFENIIKSKHLLVLYDYKRKKI